MKTILHFLLTLLLILFFQVSGKSHSLSNQAQISILTCSPGTELYSLFGHTAIRVYDPVNRYDQVFNYGTFDFQTPYFYLKYAQGLLPYQLSTTPFRHFMIAYQMEGRSVYSQTLHLDSLQRQKLFDLLLENYKPTNRCYLYNFLFDNCTTRARDILQKTFPDAIEWNITENGKSFWNLLDEYLKTSPWVHWGIHTILGQRGNREATPLQYMFLPDYLMSGLTTAQYENHPIATSTETLYKASEITIKHPWYYSPLFVFMIGTLLLIGTFIRFKNRIWLNSWTILLFLFSGIVGCLIVFLGGFTAHPITAPNWNILWANPLNLFLWPFIVKQQHTHWIKYYLTIYLILLLIAIPVWIFTYPAVPTASLAFIALLFYISYKQRQKTSLMPNQKNRLKNL